jgi:hypothetical protein
VAKEQSMDGGSSQPDIFDEIIASWREYKLGRPRVEKKSDSESGYSPS